MSDQTNEGEDVTTDATDGLRSPVSGIDMAMGAGASLFVTAQSMTAKRVRRHVHFELPAYLFVQSSWFMAFGLQMVLFPYLITNKLNLDGLELGLANMALSAPSVVFLLLGGVVAERLAGKPLLIALHLLAAIPILILAGAVASGNLTYGYMLAYGFGLGTVGAFMMPARDAIINEVVERRIRVGSGVTLQLGVTLATMAQFAAQIFGLIIAGYADKATRMPDWLGGFTIGPISSWRLLVIQGMIVASGAIFALVLAKGRRVRTGRSGRGAAFGDIADGFRTVKADPKLWAMTALMFGVGIFVIGSFLVVLPIINRDIYHLGSDGIRDMFVTFWFGAFVASVALVSLQECPEAGAPVADGAILRINRHPRHAVGNPASLFPGDCFCLGHSRWHLDRHEPLDRTGRRTERSARPRALNLSAWLHGRRTVRSLCHGLADRRVRAAQDRNHPGTWHDLPHRLDDLQNTDLELARREKEIGPSGSDCCPALMRRARAGPSTARIGRERKNA